MRITSVAESSRRVAACVRARASRSMREDRAEPWFDRCRGTSRPPPISNVTAIAARVFSSTLIGPVPSGLGKPSRVPAAARVIRRQRIRCFGVAQRGVCCRARSGTRASSPRDGDWRRAGASRSGESSSSRPPAVRLACWPPGRVAMILFFCRGRGRTIDARFSSPSSRSGITAVTGRAGCTRLRRWWRR